MPHIWSVTSGDIDSNWRDCEDERIWFGEQKQIEWYDQATTPWQELYHEEDYQGIADQILAEDLGYDTL